MHEGSSSGGWREAGLSVCQSSLWIWTFTVLGRIRSVQSPSQESGKNEPLAPAKAVWWWSSTQWGRTCLDVTLWRSVTRLMFPYLVENGSFSASEENGSRSLSCMLPHYWRVSHEEQTFSHSQMSRKKQHMTTWIKCPGTAQTWGRRRSYRQTARDWASVLYTGREQVSLKYWMFK